MYGSATKRSSKRASSKNKQPRRVTSAPFRKEHRAASRINSSVALPLEIPRKLSVSTSEPPFYHGCMGALLDVCGLVVELPTADGWVRPVNEVSLQIAAGEALGLVGESGSGKTMLSLALMGLLPAGARVRGEVWLAGAARQVEEVHGNGQKSRDARHGDGWTDLLRLREREWRAIRGGHIAMVFQEPMTSLNPVMRIGV